MNQPDFQEWFAQHRAAFPEISPWLHKLEQIHKTNSDAPSAQAVLRQWLKALADVGLEEATEATAAILRGDVDKPKAYSDHPAAIRHHARSKRSRAPTAAPPKRPATYARPHEGGEVSLAEALGMLRTTRSFNLPLGGYDEAFKCLECEDSGTITVYHPTTVEAMERMETDTPIYTREVACFCEMGQRKFNLCGQKQYHPDSSCKVTTISGIDRREQVFRWVQANCGAA